MAAFQTNKVSPTQQKLRGGYYTPLPLAEFLAAWAIRSGEEHVLEPSCGDGNFVAVAASRLGASGKISAVELLSSELTRAKQRVKDAASPIDWFDGDFFARFADLKSRGPFDVVLGNPPFIRFQHFDSDARDVAFSHLRSFGYRPNGLANAWCAFVQLTAELVAVGGRMAYVVPAELLQVGYAQELRDRLPRMFRDVVLVAFDELVFPDIQQEVVLLLAEGRRARPSNSGALHTINVRNGNDLLQSDLLNRRVAHLPERHTRPGMKWTSLFLEPFEFDVLNEVQARPDVPCLADFAEVDVGIVTGRNSFFVISPSEADRIGVNGFAVPTVGRTSALKSIFFDASDLERFSETNPARLINLKGIDQARFSEGLREYIHSGERDGINTGYKCSIRPRWFDVPSVYVPDAFLFRQIHHAPFLVANHAAATTTDTIHRVRVRSGIDRDRLCAASINSLTFAWAEVCGRSYGGGVLELEPREAEELPCLYQYASGLDADYIDAKLREGQLISALEHADDILLRRGLGLTQGDVARVRNAWCVLRDRRHGRRRAAKG
jgi:adenine-specific DNA methylase